MSWLVSILAAMLTGLLCGGGSLWLSLHAVKWYRVSNREGAAGYAAVGLAIIGAVIGAVVGLIAARVGVAYGWDGAGEQFLCAVGVGLSILGTAALITRALADIPPLMDGREIICLIEFRYTEAQVTQPNLHTDTAAIHLGSLRTTARVMRIMRKGTIQLDQMRFENGHWIVPASVEVFTSRGRRILMATLGDTSQGFVLPLPRRPGKKHQSWSDWLPKPRRDGLPSTSKLSFRFRVQPAEDFQ